MRTWRILCCLALCLFISRVMSPVSAIGETVRFPDANLESAIRNALNKPSGDITTEEMGGLTELNVSARGIKELSGIEFAVHLRSLNLSHNAIRDVSKIGALTNLETLILNSNEIVNIDPLANLYSLKSLWLMNNQISGLGVFTSLQKLEDLYMVNNRIGNLAGLEGLLQLKNLNLAKNQIQDIAPIKTITQLQSLDLEGNNISNIRGVESLEQLQWLSFAFNPVNDIRPLNSLSQLKYLNLRGYAVSTASNQILKEMGNRGGLVDYALVMPSGTYIYDVNLDGIADTNDINDAINYYLNLNDTKRRHPELKISGNEIDPVLLDGTTYIYDVNRDGVVDTNDINDLINFYLNLNEMKNKHPEYKVFVK